MGVPPPVAPARLRVQVVRGADGAGLPHDAPPTYVLADLRRPRDAGADGGARALRRATLRYLAALPATTPVEIALLDGASGASCGAARWLHGEGPDWSGPALAKRLETWSPAPGASLTASLQALAVRLPGDLEEPAAARVVVFSPFPAACGLDLCEATRALVARGAEIDLVAVGEAPLPACLATMAAPRVPAGETRPVVPRAAEALPFRIEPRGGQDGVTGREGRFVPAFAEGRTDQGEVEVAPGLVRVEVGLEPIEEVWPLRLAPGRSHRVRVLDVPLLPLRRVFVDRPRQAPQSSDREVRP